MKKFLLTGIILLAATLRLWGLGDFPALNADEAAIGYNAYSLLETGRDEHGNPWPIHFQSFNDYKPGLYFYLVLPFVKVLGLTVWAVRLPGALLGVGTVYLLHLFVKEIFGNKKHALLGALLLAISPWHIHFSRGGWEVNTATFLILLGIYLFIRAIRSSSQGLYIFSAASLVASLYAYHAARVIVPLLGLGLILIHKESLKKNIKSFLVAGLIGLLLLSPLAIDLTKGSVFSRAAGVGLFSDPGPLSRINEQRGQHSNFAGLSAELLHNKVVNYGLAFMENWAEHFHGEFLFLSGEDIQRNKVPETGELYIYEIITLLVGAFAIARLLGKGGEEKKGWLFVLFWLAVAPTAAALTFQSPHALRAQNMVIPFVIISSFGLVTIINWLEERKLKIGVWFVVLVMAWGLARYELMYWKHMSQEYPFSSQYGVEELVDYVTQNLDKYSRVVTTDRYDQPYILFLFYMKYSPEKFQGEHVITPRDQYGFSTVRDFGKFTFVSIDSWEGRRSEYPNSLIAGTDMEIPDEANVLKDIYGTNNHLYFQVVGN